MPRLKDFVAPPPPDMAVALARADALVSPFCSGWADWLAAPVAAGRLRGPLKPASISAMHRDVVRFVAHALRGATGPWVPPAGAGRHGNAVRDALLGGELDKGVSIWASEMLRQGTLSADTVRRSLNSLVRWAARDSAPLPAPDPRHLLFFFARPRRRSS